MNKLLFWIAGICLGAGCACESHETKAGAGYIILGVVLTTISGALTAGDDKCDTTSTSSKTEK
jgi:hypothetical protein